MVWFKFAAMAAAGIAGGLFATHLRVPAGGLIGALTGVALLNLFVFPLQVQIPQAVRLSVQIAVGIMLGAGITWPALEPLRGKLHVAVAMASGFLVFGLAVALIMRRFGGIDWLTALFSSAPGGIAEMTLLADSQGANAPTVAVFHLTRVLFTIFLVPLLVARLTDRVP